MQSKEFFSPYCIRTFWLFHRATVAFCLLCSLLVGAFYLMGTPILCMAVSVDLVQTRPDHMYTLIKFSSSKEEKNKKNIVGNLSVFASQRRFLPYKKTAFWEQNP